MSGLMTWMMSTEIKCNRNPLSELESFVLISRRFKLNENVLINYLHDSVTAQFHTVHRNFQKVQPYVNKFCMFRANYLVHFLHNFYAQGVILKGKALTT